MIFPYEIMEKVGVTCTRVQSATVCVCVCVCVRNRKGEGINYAMLSVCQGVKAKGVKQVQSKKKGGGAACKCLLL